MGCIRPPSVLSLVSFFVVGIPTKPMISREGGRTSSTFSTTKQPYAKRKHRQRDTVRSALALPNIDVSEKTSRKSTFIITARCITAPASSKGFTKHGFAKVVHVGLMLT